MVQESRRLPKFVTRWPGNCAVAVGLLICGCGKNPQPAPEQSGSGGAAVSAETPANAAATQVGPEQPSSSERGSSSGDGRRMIGDIPLDVWLDDPLQVAASGGPVNPAPENPADTATPDMAANAEPAANNTETPPAAGWKDSITGDAISKEVTSITNFMRTKLQSVGTFKQAIFQLPAQSATLSVFAQIAADHPDEIRWQKNATFIRDLAATMHQEKLQPTRRFFEPVSKAYEQIGDIMSGSAPGGDAPEPTVDFVDLAEMRLLMMRMEVARDTMKTDAGNEDSFKASADMVRHETAVLRTLMKVCLTEGYGYGDDEDFLGLAKPILDSTKKMQDAVETGDFETYDAGLSQVFQSCSECHTQYKNN